jgi:DNA-binding MarR family transcriptional regulator
MKSLPDALTIQAWARIARAQTRLFGMAESALKAAGLPPLSWYDVLLELWRAPGNDLRQFEIGQRLLLPKHNLSRLIDRLESAGLVERQPCDEDGRGHVVRITHEGVAMLRRMWPIYGDVIERELGAKLPRKEIRALASTLGKLLSPDLPARSGPLPNY